MGRKKPTHREERKRTHPEREDPVRTEPESPGQRECPWEEAARVPEANEERTARPRTPQVSPTEKKGHQGEKDHGETREALEQWAPQSEHAPSGEPSEPHPTGGGTRKSSPQNRVHAPQSTSIELRP